MRLRGISVGHRRAGYPRVNPQHTGAQARHRGLAGSSPAAFSPKPIVQHDCTVLIQTPEMLAAVDRCVLLGIRQRRPDGLPAHDLLELAKTLFCAHTAATSRSRHELVDSVPAESCCEGQGASDWCSVGEAAALLRLSRRQVQRPAADSRWGGVDGVCVGRAWMLRRVPVLALAKVREREAK